MTKTNFSKLSLRSLLGASLVVIALLVISVPLLASADTLYRQLEIGMSGADVTALQTFLAQDPTIYPQGLITGYFGSLTKSAVSNFQARNGISSVGRVGPATLPVLNLQMSLGMSTPSGGVAPVITSLSVNTNQNGATVNWNTNESAKGVVYYNTSPLVLTELPNNVLVSGGNSMMTDTNFRTSQSVSITGLSSNTTYYYMIYTTDQTGNVTVSWPSTFRTSN
jgi:peptidoglycan hydrolase-like protein with peptidoglycan-binding domain